MNLIIKSLTVLCLCLISAACSFTGSKIPGDHYYRLPDAKFEKMSSPDIESLLIKPVMVEGLYHERSILYVDHSSPLEMKRYHYHYWVNTPAKIVHQYLFNALDQSGISKHLVKKTSKASAVNNIDITITHFERLMQADQIEVLLSLQVSIENTDSASGANIHHYSAKKSVSSNDMHATVEAFGEAMNDITHLLIEDLSK